MYVTDNGCHGVSLLDPDLTASVSQSSNKKQMATLKLR